MQISLQTIIDLILKTFKQQYQEENIKIESLNKSSKRVSLYVKCEKYEDRKFEIEIWYKLNESKNDYIITSINLGLLVNPCEFPTYLGEFSCDALVTTINALTIVLKGCSFKPAELVELM